MGVRMHPGAIAFTVIPNGANSTARDFVNLMIAPVLAA
jgi:hypothetical protein